MRVVVNVNAAFIVMTPKVFVATQGICAATDDAIYWCVIVAVAEQPNTHMPAQESTCRPLFRRKLLQNTKIDNDIAVVLFLATKSVFIGTVCIFIFICLFHPSFSPVTICSASQLIYHFPFGIYICLSMWIIFWLIGFYCCWCCLSFRIRFFRHSIMNAC